MDAATAAAYALGALLLAAEAAVHVQQYMQITYVSAWAKSRPGDGKELAGPRDPSSPRRYD